MADLTGMMQAAAGADGGVSTPWELTNATYNGSPINFFILRSQETDPQGVFFKPDGTKMYIVGSSGDAVYEYDLSSAWDVSSASFLQSFSVATQETIPQGVFFKPDGTKMYIVGSSGDDVNEYNLSSAWDISTASYLQNFSVASQDINPTGLFFKPDGTKMYVVGDNGQDINEYNLSSAWDISSASYLQSFSVSAQEQSPRTVFFKSDGTKMYVAGDVNDTVYEYNLSSAWNISTASYLQSFSLSAQEGSISGIFFKSDGTKMYGVGLFNDTIYQYDLSSAWNISTASFTYPTTNYFNVSAQELSSEGLFFKPDGTKMYIVGSSGDEVNEYDLSSAWDISSASFLQNFSVAAQEANPRGVFFKPDGTKMYIVGSSGDDVNEYDLSSAWDISTASYLQNFSISAQETVPQGLFFKPDGTKMYIIGSSGDDVNEYNLSSAWDISSASYVQNFSVVSQTSSPSDLFLRENGLQMFIIGSSSVFQYNLSSAWDISTASYVQNFSVAGQELNDSGLFFKSDGTIMYVTGTGGNIWSYDL
jgi:DNA-binding beta-propeller fold protein YncE